jgi:hypothetical protein
MFQSLSDDNEDRKCPTKTNCEFILLAPKSGYTLVVSRKTKRRLKQKNIELKTEGQIRTEAFDILSDPSKTAEKLRNTEMCVQGKKCTRKDCRFAHSHDELKLTQCFFGVTCRHINDRCKLCTKIHPQETEEEYYERVKGFSKDDIPMLH